MTKPFRVATPCTTVRGLVRRGVIAIGLTSSLGGCALGYGAYLAGNYALAGASLASMQSGSGTIDDIERMNRITLQGDAMEEALGVGRQRHPDVFDNMTIRSDSFQCLWEYESSTYQANVKSKGHRASLQAAVDKAAKRYRNGECKSSASGIKGLVDSLLGGDTVNNAQYQCESRIAQQIFDRGGSPADADAKIRKECRG